jgi:methionyl-tRNA formyltransferase
MEALNSSIMKKTSEPIVFFGSGPVAAESLRLLAQNFDIEAVITKPRPAHHKGDVPVLSLAEDLQLPIHTVASKRGLLELIRPKPFKARLGILIDFGIIVPQEVIDHFPLGIVNSHFSILPEWRGADPITFAILSGQEMTGVSLMLLTAGMDEGPLLGHTTLKITDDMTSPRLTELLIKQSKKALDEIIPLYLEGKVKPAAQETVAKSLNRASKPTYSRKLTKEDGVIDWKKPAVELEREIRAFIDWPKSHTVLASKEIIITKAYVVPSSAPKAKPGDITIVKHAGAIAVTTGNGSLWIQRLKPVGKREMSATEFLAGYKL